MRIKRLYGNDCHLHGLLGRLLLPLHLCLQALERRGLSETVVPHAFLLVFVLLELALCWADLLVAARRTRGQPGWQPHLGGLVFRDDRVQLR